jgi:hypothetical protein
MTHESQLILLWAGVPIGVVADTCAGHLAFLNGGMSDRVQTIAMTPKGMFSNSFVIKDISTLLFFVQRIRTSIFLRFCI